MTEGTLLRVALHRNEAQYERDCAIFTRTTNPDSNKHALPEWTCYLMSSEAKVCELSSRRDIVP